jgi:ethanolamine utilization microcompartment shell protein EutL
LVNHGGSIVVNTTVIHHRPMSRESPQFKLRMPEDLHGRVFDAAGEAGRSMNAEIVFRLERSFEAGQGKSSSSDVRDVLAALKSAAASQDASIRMLAGLLEVVVGKLDDGGDAFARDVKKDIREFARLIKAGDVASAHETAGARLRHRVKK